MYMYSHPYDYRTPLLVENSAYVSYVCTTIDNKTQGLESLKNCT